MVLLVIPMRLHQQRRTCVSMKAVGKVPVLFCGRWRAAVGRIKQAGFEPG